MAQSNSSVIDNPLMASSSSSTIPNPLTSPSPSSSLQQQSKQQLKSNNNDKNQINNRSTKPKFDNNHEYKNNDNYNNNRYELILPLKIDTEKAKRKNNSSSGLNDSSLSFSSSIASSPRSIPSSPTTSQTAPKVKHKSIFDQSLNSHRNKTVSLSAFAHLFCALIQYSQVGVKNVDELEQRLSTIGIHLFIEKYIECKDNV